MTAGSIAQRCRRENFCCVTTRGLKGRRLGSLWQGLEIQTACFLRLGVLSFDGLMLSSFGLSSGGEPASDETEAFGILAIELVPASGSIFSSAAFAQAGAKPRSSAPGSALWFMMRMAHGSVSPKGQPGGNARTFSSGVIQNKPPRKAYGNEGEPNKEGNGLRKACPSTRRENRARRSFLIARTRE
jgi:hypothetical protein